MNGARTGAWFRAPAGLPQQSVRNLEELHRAPGTMDADWNSRHAIGKTLEHRQWQMGHELTEAQCQLDSCQTMDRCMQGLVRARPPSPHILQSHGAMPRVCGCGERLRRDLSCPTPSCRRFRPCLRGANLATRVALRVRGKQPHGAVRARPAKDHRAGRRSLPAAAALDVTETVKDAVGDVSRASVPCEGQLSPRQLLRAVDLEALLVGLFGEPAYFAILAVAFRRRAASM
jgi:hypothetical protein